MYFFKCTFAKMMQAVALCPEYGAAQAPLIRMILF